MKIDEEQHRHQQNGNKSRGNCQWKSTSRWLPWLIRKFNLSVRTLTRSAVDFNYIFVSALLAQQADAEGAQQTRSPYQQIKHREVLFEQRRISVFSLLMMMLSRANFVEISSSFTCWFDFERASWTGWSVDKVFLSIVGSETLSLDSVFSPLTPPVSKVSNFDKLPRRSRHVIKVFGFESEERFN